MGYTFPSLKDSACSCVVLAWLALALHIKFWCRCRGGNASSCLILCHWMLDICIPCVFSKGRKEAKRSFGNRKDELGCMGRLYDVKLMMNYECFATWVKLELWTRYLEWSTWQLSKSRNCKEWGREVGDSSAAFFTTHKRERTQGWRLKPFFTLAHNNNTIEEGNTLYVKP